MLRHPTPMCSDDTGNRRTRNGDLVRFKQLSDWAADRYSGTEHQMNDQQIAEYNERQLGHVSSRVGD